MILMRLIHIEKRLERLMAGRFKAVIRRQSAVATTPRKIKIRKRKGNRS
jgi:hypothetical protein